LEQQRARLFFRCRLHRCSIVTMIGRFLLAFWLQNGSSFHESRPHARRPYDTHKENEARAKQLREPHATSGR
jgi:hypothetical protein